MRLTDLHPEWMNAGGEGVSQPGPDLCKLCDGVGCEECHSTGKIYVPAPLRVGVGVLCNCPCGNKEETHQLYVPFSNPIDGSVTTERGWQRTGDTFETLTLTPSILRIKPSCGWHGFITNGEVITV